MLMRRGFIQGSTLVLFAPFAVACSSGDDDDAKDGACDGAGARTTSSSGHTHFACVTGAALANPSSGTSFETSVDQGHSHDVSLSAAQLTDIAGGGTVTVTTSTNGGHSHDLSLKRNG